MHDPLVRLRAITERGGWPKVVEAGGFEPPISVSFRTYWTEAGHHIRRQVGDDIKLVAFLRLTLPSYEGPPVILYRGENLSRWQAGRVGLCWSRDRKTARIFGRGLNAINGGGVLLSTFAPSEAILSGPGEHSDHLGEAEFIIDVSKLTGVEMIETY